MRICTSCGEEHELAFFNRDASRATGHDPRCKNCTRRACKRTYGAHAEKHKAMKLAWKRANPERRQELGREWRAKNPDKTRAGTANYRERLKRATPPWVNEDELKRIRANRPDGHHVDHIVPLAGRNISGLNVPWNLQYLPAQESWEKGNRFVEAEGVCHL